MIADPSCPPDTIFMMPPDVKQGLDALHAIAQLRAHGIISEELFAGLAKEITDQAVKAAREGRIGVITNIGQP